MKLAIDVGGTKVAVGVGAVTAQGPQWQRVETFAAARTAQAICRDVMDWADQLVDGPITGVGISFGGHVEAGRIQKSVQVPGWENSNLPGRLIARFHVPVSVSNDASAGALGEWIFGAGRGTDHLLYLTVSTGVGSGIIANRAPYDGAGLAGELGHVRMPGVQDRCGCGRVGCVEAVAAGPAIAREYERLTGRSALPPDIAVLAELPREVGGEDAARAVMARAGQAVAYAVSLGVAVLDPQVVVVGGGVARSTVFWEALDAHAQSPHRPRIRLARAQLDNPCLAGALALAP